MSLVGVAEAAEELGVSQRRVRQMLADGSLAGERVGGAWVVDQKASHGLSRRRRSVGRPWHAASAWAVLALLNGEEIDASPVERSRARRRVDAGLRHSVERLAARAVVKHFYAHPAVLERLADSPGVVRSGVSAAGEYDIDVIASAVFEGYASASSLAGLVEQYALEQGAERSNVILRIVEDDVWPFRSGESVASGPVVAVDLLDADDERSRRAGAALLERL